MLCGRNACKRLRDAQPTQFHGVVPQTQWSVCTSRRALTVPSALALVFGARARVCDPTPPCGKLTLPPPLPAAHLHMMRTLQSSAVSGRKSGTPRINPDSGNRCARARRVGNECAPALRNSLRMPALSVFDRLAGASHALPSFPLPPAVIPPCCPSTLIIWGFQSHASRVRVQPVRWRPLHPPAARASPCDLVGRSRAQPTLCHLSTTARRAGHTPPGRASARLLDRSGSGLIRRA